MSVSTFALIVFFAVFGLDTFFNIPGANIILGVAALVIAIALIAKN